MSSIGGQKLDVVKMRLLPGKANPAPPVGSILGARGLNIMQFCKAFNDETKDFDMKDLPRIVYIYVNKKDKTFTFKVCSLPTASDLIKNALALKSGSKEPGKAIVSTVTKAKLEEIAKLKMVDMNASSLDAAVKSLSGTARSIGISVVN